MCLKDFNPRTYSIIKHIGNTLFELLAYIENSEKLTQEKDLRSVYADKFNLVNKEWSNGNLEIISNFNLTNHGYPLIITKNHLIKYLNIIWEEKEMSDKFIKEVINNLDSNKSKVSTDFYFKSFYSGFKNENEKFAIFPVITEKYEGVDYGVIYKKDWAIKDIVEFESIELLEEGINTFIGVGTEASGSLEDTELIFKLPRLIFKLPSGTKILLILGEMKKVDLKNMVYHDIIKLIEREVPNANVSLLAWASSFIDKSLFQVGT